MKCPILLIATCLLVACGDEDDRPRANSVEELENRLEKLADRTTEEIEPEPRLTPLRRGDVGDEYRGRPSCRLHRDGAVYLIVNQAGGLARIDGRAVRLSVSGPVGPTGGFLKAPNVTMSVGRTEPSGGDEAAQYGLGWPARASVGGDRERPVEKVEATWICIR